MNPATHAKSPEQAKPTRATITINHAIAQAKQELHCHNCNSSDCQFLLS